MSIRLTKTITPRGRKLPSAPKGKIMKDEIIDKWIVWLLCAKSKSHGLRFRPPIVKKSYWLMYHLLFDDNHRKKEDANEQ